VSHRVCVAFFSVSKAVTEWLDQGPHALAFARSYSLSLSIRTCGWSIGHCWRAGCGVRLNMFGLLLGTAPPTQPRPNDPPFSSPMLSIHTHLAPKIKSVLHRTPSFAATVSNLKIRGLPMRAQKYSNQNQKKTPPGEEVGVDLQPARKCAISQSASCT
jgi:hypothetical protein